MRDRVVLYSLITLSLFLYVLLGYFVQRHDTAILLLLFACLFAIFMLLKNRIKHNVLIIATIFRLSLLFSVPALSDDVYRFIWDGELLDAGIHPFAHPPSFFINREHQAFPIADELYLKLNSKHYYTIYPPIAQLLFWLAAHFGNTILNSIIILRAFIIIFDIGTIILATRLLKLSGKNQNNVLIYAINPLVVLELTGNLHLEGMMLFFLLIMVVMLWERKFIAGAVAFASAICVKLVPLLFVPALLKTIPRRSIAIFFASTIVFTALLFYPLLDIELLIGMRSSLRYYFQQFEFNASIYYAVREIGYLIAGFNIIAWAGTILGIIAAILIIILVTKRKIHHDFGVLELMFGSLLIFCLLTTTLHPWYIIPLLMLSIFTDLTFVVLWSALIFLTYSGYSSEGFQENLWIVTMEYVLVFLFFLYELRWKKNRIAS